MGNCSGTFTVGDTRVRCGKNRKCYHTLPIAHPSPQYPKDKHSTCLVLFLCSRANNIMRSRNTTDPRFTGLNQVYYDRIPRWRTFEISTFSVDACASMSPHQGGFSTPGVVPLNFNGSTSKCVWGCPTKREKIALAYADRHLPNHCEFVFKITGKYFAPSFGREYALIPNDADLAVQSHTFNNALSQNSEMYGIRRTLIRDLLRETHGDAERQLRSFSTKRCSKVHRMNLMPLLNRTMRSDWRTLTTL